MTFSARLTLLRFYLEETYRRQQKATGKRSPGLHFLLPVPLPERLILLYRLDGTPPKAIKQLLQASDEDITLESERMRQAIQQMQQSLRHPFDYLPADPILEGGGYAWSDRYGRELERRMRQLVFPSAALCLFGEAAIPQLRDLTLMERTVLYLLLVQSSDWQEIQALTGCTEHTIRLSLKKAMERIQQPAHQVKAQRLPLS